MRRRLLVLLLLGVIATGGAAVTLAARRRLGRLRLRLLGPLPFWAATSGAKAVTDSATHTVRSTGKVVSALQRSRRGPPDPNVEPEGL